MDTYRKTEAMSEFLSEKGETHVVFCIDRRTKGLKVVGDEQSVEEFFNNGALMAQITQCLQAVAKYQAGEKLKSTCKISLNPKTRAGPFHNAESARTTCSQVLSVAGFGLGDKKIGSSDPPEGWPYPYIWADFKGPSRVSFLVNCNIIRGLMDGRDFNEV